MGGFEVDKHKYDNRNEVASMASEIIQEVIQVSLKLPLSNYLYTQQSYQNLEVIFDLPDLKNPYLGVWIVKIRWEMAILWTSLGLWFTC